MINKDVIAGMKDGAIVLNFARDTLVNEDDMLEQVLRTYRILMNRAVKGVYIYACDDALNKYLQQFFDGK